MTKFGRIQHVLTGIMMILFGLLLAAEPEAGFPVIILILCITLIASGIRYIKYYTSMARYMVGGKSVLIMGIIVLDFGIFTITMSQVPLTYLMIYLLAIHAFSGVIDILRALESRSQGGRHWKLKFSTGVINILLAVVAMIIGYVTHSPEAAVYLYTAGLVWSGVSRIITAFQKTTLVYIQ